MARISKLNISGVLESFNSFLSSSDGKDFASAFSINNKSAILSKDDAIRMAEELKKMIITYAGMEFTTSQLSIFNSINNMDIGAPIDNGDGSLKIELYLSGDLRRPSLDPFEEGAYDIVSLFIHGWSPKKHANDSGSKRLWGYWHGVLVGAREQKDPMDFASNAIEEFNREYEHFGVHAELNEKYK